MTLKQNEEATFPTRIVMCMVADQIAAEVHIARVGALVRSLANEHGVTMPEASDYVG